MLMGGGGEGGDHTGRHITRHDQYHWSFADWLPQEPLHSVDELLLPRGNTLSTPH